MVLLAALFLMSLFLPFVSQEQGTPPSEQTETPSEQAEVPPEPPEATSDETSDEGFRIGVAVDQVFLSVSARAVRGGFVRDLTREDFRVYENDRLQEIVNFYSERVPVQVVLLIDASGSTRHSQAEIRRAALRFVESLGEDDEFAVITFNHQPRLILNWSGEYERVKTALESIYARGNTVFYDALYVTFDDLLRGVRGKSAVILLTDGIDTGSMVSFDESMDLALRSGSIVYVVSKLEEYWAGAIGYRQQLQSQSRMIPKELTDSFILEQKRALNRLANLTGGTVLDTRAFSDLTDVYAQVAEELKNQYYVSYIPTNEAKDGTWREVRVEVSRGGVAVATRRGYFAEGAVPPAN
jgi:Ca-activated chloride channel family protein